MPGVSVSIEGTVTGTITDIDGRYQLKIGKEQHNATLVFSFIGMQTQHIAYKGQHQLNVTLRDDHVALEDVVVIGYGSKNRKSLTSSISSVKKEDIERMAPVSHNIQDLLGGGMVKGVLATQNSGEPGASITINGSPYAEGSVYTCTAEIGMEPLEIVVKNGGLEKTYTLASHNYMLKNAGDGFTMFQGCALLQDEVMLDNQVLINYITQTLDGVVGEAYADPYGEGRIVAVPEAPEA